MSQRPHMPAPADEVPCLVQPGLAFRPDSSGGYGELSPTGQRHDVLAREAPPWLAAVIEAAAEASRPLLLRRLGRAGKYRFWSTDARSASELLSASTAAEAERDTARATRDVADLLAGHALDADQAVVLPDGELLVAQAARVHGRRGYTGYAPVALVEGELVSLPAAARVERL